MAAVRKLSARRRGTPSSDADAVPARGRNEHRGQRRRLPAAGGHGRGVKLAYLPSFAREAVREGIW